jgi:predicted metal-dependent enzyme (double-stranded beta helix superfamily)
MTTIAQAGLGQPQLAGIVRSFAATPQDWIGQVRLNAEGRWYERILVEPDHDVWIITWLPGQATGFHDHGSSVGAFTAAWGVLEEHHDGTVLAVTAGTARTFGPGYVHDVRNASAAPVVSVHAYSPPLTEMTRYDLTPGGLAVRGTETGGTW